MKSTEFKITFSVKDKEMLLWGQLDYIDAVLFECSTSHTLLQVIVVN